MRKILASAIAISLLSFNSAAELPTEETMQIETLPAEYPKDWIFVHDVSFYALTEGKVVILDLAAKTLNYKGLISASVFGNFIQSEKTHKLYTGESFYARSTRGARTDAITEWDPATLKPVDEIILPGNERAQAVAEKNALQFVDDEKYMLIFKFSPAVKVGIIKTDTKEILNDIDIPGCSLIYPTGKRGFSSLCADGTMVSIQFDEAGQVVSEHKVDAFFDPDSDPLFEKTAVIDGIAYFPSFKGQMQPIDLTGSVAKPMKAWSLVTEAERAQNWRPGGWQVISGDGKSLVYVLMHKDGYNGSHKDSAQELWVFDVHTKKKVKSIPLLNGGISVEVTRSANPLLAIINNEMRVDVYSADTGKFTHSLSIGGPSVVPLVMHAAK